MVKYHLGWETGAQLEFKTIGGFHSTTLVNFRQRLLENDKGHVAFQTVLEALQKEGPNSEARYSSGSIRLMSFQQCAI